MGFLASESRQISSSDKKGSRYKFVSPLRVLSVLGG